MKITDANSAYCAMVGYSNEEIIERDALNWQLTTTKYFFWKTARVNWERHYRGMFENVVQGLFMQDATIFGGAVICHRCYVIPTIYSILADL